MIDQIWAGSISGYRYLHRGGQAKCAECLGVGNRLVDIHEREDHRI